ncbi:NAD dependent epimerase/dehydratase family protein [Nonomuraea solani]|uniref:NAD dependent epimerase/dehydratase family protein n=1 Tax=Nonomuraea solani TaxID=1144553 RepID=A0A1H6E2A8_9ACTN|nr:NAD-dependent epimerase/dehydratase family protein [Nonomuraea solani]SEG91045.1 NAD dependent epimerase/dehydratase family protein [Nonomuraea solani]
MRVIIFGATGMVGRGVLRECLLDERVTAVLGVGRSATGVAHAKLREIRHADLLDLTAIEGELGGYDACFFCLGVSSVGMAEADYRRITYDVTLSVGRTLARLGPGSTFVYVSGAGTDARGRAMWARVKGETENALLALPLEGYMFRPGYIQPMHGVTSRTRFYRLAYVVTRPLYPMLRRLFGGGVTTTERIGQAMIAVAERGAPRRILGPADINAL